MNHFLYNPVTQYDNTGDLLINKSLIYLLRTYGQVIIDDRKKPTTFINQLIAPQDQKLSELTEKGLFSFLEGKLSRSMQSVDDVYYLVLVPGDFSKQGLKKALSGLKFYFRLRKLKKLGCRILRIGASLSTFDLPNYIVESLYSTTYFAYGLRDKQSMAKAARFRFSNVRYFPDLAWAYHPNLIERESDVTERYILISFRANQSGTIHDRDFFSNVKHQLFALLSHDAFDDYKIVVSYQVQYDREASQELVDLFADKFEVEFIDRLLSLDEAVHLYTHADLVISNRLHVVLLGSICHTLSVPFINPLDNKKIASIYQDNAIYDLVLDYRDDITRLRDRLVNLVERKDAVRGLLEDKRKHNAQIIENTVKTLLSVNNARSY